MKKAITRPPKVALCRMCKGTGIVATEPPKRYPDLCPQCEGSGRVTVSCEMTLDIRPYRPKPRGPIKKHITDNGKKARHIL